MSVRRWIKRFTTSLFWRVLKRNKPAFFGMLLVLFYIFMALFADVISPHDPVAMNLSVSLQPPSNEYPLGTDPLGRCILSRIFHGSRISLWIGAVAITIGAGIGVPIGLLSAYYRKADFILQRFVDVLLAFPGILLSLLIVSILGPGLVNAMIAVGITAISGFARVTRGTALSVKELEFVEAARALGVSDFTIIFRHILLNCMGPLMVRITLYMGAAILFAAGLGFLGLGAQPPTPEWGAMVSSGRAYILSAPHVVTFPGLTIFGAVLGLNLFGDGLREMIDPRLRKRF